MIRVFEGSGYRFVDGQMAYLFSMRSVLVNSRTPGNSAKSDFYRNRYF